MTPMIGMIVLWGSPQIPEGWFACDGSSLLIEQYLPLYSLLGSTYGGDSQTYFNLPDLRSRIPVCIGQGFGLSYYYLGQTGGAEGVALTQSELAPHNHAVTSNPRLSGTATLSAQGYLPISTQPGSSTTPGTNMFPAQAPDYSSTGLPALNIYGISNGSNIPVTINISPTPSSIAISGPLNVQVQNAGQGNQHPNIQPFIGLQYIIAYLGLYPDPSN